MRFSHHLLAYQQMLSRDAGSLADAAARADVSPLGSGALAGTTFPSTGARPPTCWGSPTSAPTHSTPSLTVTTPSRSWPPLRY